MVGERVLSLIESREQLDAIAASPIIGGAQPARTLFVVTLQPEQLPREVIVQRLPCATVESVRALEVDLGAMNRAIVDLVRSLAQSRRRGLRAFDRALRFDYQFHYLHTLYVEAIVRAALRWAKPTWVVIPPSPSGWLHPVRHDDPSVGSLAQRVAKAEGLKTLVLGRVRSRGLLFALVKRAVATLFREFRFWLGGIRIPEAPCDPPILICNFASNLHRQFDLTRLPTEIVERTLTWNPESAAWARLEHRLETECTPSAMMPAFHSEDTRLRWRCIRMPVAELAIAVAASLKLAVTWAARLIGLGAPRELVNALRRMDRTSQVDQLIDLSFLLLNDYLHARRVFRAMKPALVITSDSPRTLHSAELLAAQDLGIPNVSTCDGVVPIALSARSLLAVADYVCVPGERLAKQYREYCNSKQCVLVAGDRFRYTVATRWLSAQDATRPLVLILTSGGRGLWTQQIWWDYSRYDVELRTLVKRLVESVPAADIVIKAHPIDDRYELYESIVGNHPDRVQHRRDTLQPETLPPRTLAIAYNCHTNAVFDLLFAGIPVIHYNAALTDFCKRQYYLRLGPVCHSVEEIVGLVGRIIENDDGDRVKSLLQEGLASIRQLVPPNGKGLAEVIRAVASEVQPSAGEHRAGSAVTAGGSTGSVGFD